MTGIDHNGATAPKRIRLVRAPFMYRYFDLDVREDSILCMAAGYLEAIGFRNYDVIDFHIDRSASAEDVYDPDVDAYVISIREVSDNVHYAARLARYLRRRSSARIIFYGETARLASLGATLPSDSVIVRQNEHELAAALGLPQTGPTFETGLTARAYTDPARLGPWAQARFKGTVETTRGCHFPCRFCFINAGDNYGKRWQRRPVEAVIADIGRYYARGVKNIVFHDAEFFGAARKQYPHVRALLEAIKAHYPDLRFMIYARADTLLWFDDFELLKQAGLCNVFLGAESLVQSDLDALKKKLKVEDIFACVSALKRHDIHMHLNFILFNRNSSAATIRENIALMRGIYADNPAAVGLPHFVFSFETDWSGEAAENALSDATYVQADLDMRSQPAVEACFDATLEPYLEMCRLLAYEWLKKVVDLSHRAGARSPYWAANTIAAETGAADAPAPAAAAGHDGVAAWYGGLAEFCLDIMELYLDRFEAGALTLESLPQAKTELFERIEAYYQRLPQPLRDVVTRESHADALTYQEAAQLVELDEYWASQIPMDPEGARTHD